jgi:hypothetical protein
VTFEKLDTLIAFVTVMLGLSLLITILNQMVAALLGHRGKYLKDGIKDLLETLDPALAIHAENIANDVLTHKLVSDSIFARFKWAPQWWKLATCIRPEELTKLLKLCSAGKPYAANIDALMSQINPTIAREARMIAAAVNEAVAAAAPPAVAAAAAAGAGVPAAAPAPVTAPAASSDRATADQVMKQLSGKASAAIGRVEAAFNSAMDRVSQRFTVHMRIWTIVFAVILAFVFHLNAVAIYSRIAADASVRASLSRASDTMLERYQKLAAQQDTGTGSKEPQTNPTSTQPQTEEARLKAAQAALAGVQQKNRDLAKDLSDIKKDLASTELDLFEIPHPWYSFGGWPGFLMVLATAGLLSLGAPFWYNALKGLTNLRSAVAQKQTQETKAASTSYS